MEKPNSFKTAIVLGVMYAICLMDRQIVAILLDPIKADLQLSDTELALMSGLVFSIFYGFMGIPIARLADRTNRVKLLAWCLAVWSVMTTLSGMATNFIFLLLARMGVGIGEAGCQPAGQSILADEYDEKNRGRALAFFAAGAPVGGLIAFTLGGYLADTYGWRMTLILAGVPGLLFAVLLKFLIKEPVRKTENSDKTNLSTQKEIFHLLKNKLFRQALLAHLACVCLGYTCMMWIPTLMVRSFDLSLTQTGMYIGITAVFGGLVGSLGSGVITDKLVAKDETWLGRFPMLLCAIAAPIFLLCLLSSNFYFFIATFTLTITFANAHTPPCYATYHRAVANEHRAMAVALSTLTVNIIGLGLAPLIIGALSDWLAPTHGEDSLKVAMQFTLIYLPLAAVGFYLVQRSLSEVGKDENYSKGIAEIS